MKVSTIFRYSLLAALLFIVIFNIVFPYHHEPVIASNDGVQVEFGLDGTNTTSTVISTRTLSTFTYTTTATATEAKFNEDPVTYIFQDNVGYLVLFLFMFILLMFAYRDRRRRR